MRLLFASTPTTGHVQPMLGLAIAAREAGHEIAWATGQEGRAHLLPHGLRAFAVGSAWEEVRRTYRDRWLRGMRLEPRTSSAFSFPHLFGAVAAHDMLDELTAVVADFRPDLVVHETGCLAAPLASRLNHVPHINHAFGLPPPASTLESAQVHLAPAWVRRGLAVPVLCGLFDHGAIEFAPPALRALGVARPQAMRIWWQRPASVTAAPGDVLAEPLRNSLQAASEHARPVVYVTLGTVFNAPVAFDNVLQAARLVEAAFVVTTGSQLGLEERSSARARACANVWVEAYVPQSLLLRHCAAAISHAGSGTAFGVAAQGLPQLFIPQGADQFRNADAFAAAGAALVLEGAAATPQAIAKATRRLIDEPSFRAAARLLQNDIAAMPVPADTVRELARCFGARRPA